MELRIHAVSKTYANGVKALNKVSLTITRGMFGLLGPNGSGKTTLMRTIATLQEPDQPLGRAQEEARRLLRRHEAAIRRGSGPVGQPPVAYR